MGSLGSRRVSWEQSLARFNSSGRNNYCASTLVSPSLGRKAQRWMSKALSCLEEFVIRSPHQVFMTQCKRVVGNHLALERAAQANGRWKPDPPLTSGEWTLVTYLCRASSSAVWVIMESAAQCAVRTRCEHSCKPTGQGTDQRSQDPSGTEQYSNPAMADPWAQAFDIPCCPSRVCIPKDQHDMLHTVCAWCMYVLYYVLAYAILYYMYAATLHRVTLCVYTILYILHHIIVYHPTHTVHYCVYYILHYIHYTVLPYI